MATLLSRKDSVLSYLKKYRKITPEQAYRHCHTMRLACQIFELRREGYAIDTEIVHETNSEGRHITYARYTLLEDNDDRQLSLG